MSRTKCPYLCEMKKAVSLCLFVSPCHSSHLSLVLLYIFHVSNMFNYYTQHIMMLHTSPAVCHLPLVCHPNNEIHKSTHTHTHVQTNLLLKSCHLVPIFLSCIVGLCYVSSLIFNEKTLNP